MRPLEQIEGEIRQILRRVEDASDEDAEGFVLKCPFLEGLQYPSYPAAYMDAMERVDAALPERFMDLVDELVDLASAEDAGRVWQRVVFVFKGGTVEMAME